MIILHVSAYYNNIQIKFYWTSHIMNIHCSHLLEVYVKNMSTSLTFPRFVVILSLCKGEIHMEYQRPNRVVYGLAQTAAWAVATFVFKRKFLRNEIRGKKGPFVVIANHQAALDFVNLIGATSRPMSFVISNSIFNTLPVKGLAAKMGVIPKQQFQTEVRDLMQIKNVIKNGEAVVIYPAGLMCEDGLSTPIPTATYKFLRWLGADVYVARTSGTYFAMPKWTKGFRPGRTYLDVYRLFSKEELAKTDLATIRQKTDEALLFDAYREQETLRVRYAKNHIVEGLEQVLYMCPHCGAEFAMQVEGGSTLRCSACGYAQESDEYGFLHHCSEVGSELRYVSDWSRLIYERLKEKLLSGQERELKHQTTIQMIDFAKNKFVDVGQGSLQLSDGQFRIEGSIHGEPVDLQISTANLASLPFKPGRYLEVQYGETIYRCVLKDGRAVMKYINMVKIFYELNHTAQPV